MIRAALAPLLLLTGPLAADTTDSIGSVTVDRPADAGVIESCLDGFPESPAACIGTAASQCTLMGDAGRTACLRAETRLWEAWRLDAFQVLIAAAEARERANPTIGKGSLTFALQQMDRAWLVYRDRLCSHAAQAFDDAASTDDAAACDLQVTALQTFELRRLETLYQTR